MNATTPGADHPPLLFDLGPRDCPVIRGGTTIAIAFILVFAAGYSVKNLVLADPPNTAEAAVALPVLAFFFITACLLRFSSTAIVLAERRLHAVEKLGPFKLVRARPLDDIVRIETRFDEVVVNGRPLEGERRLGALRIACAESARLTTAIAYPASTLIPLAVELAQACEARTPHLGRVHLAETSPAAATITTEAQPRPGAPAPPPPLPKRLRLVRAPHATTLAAPPIGLLRSLGGLLGFALFWNAIIATMIAVALFPDPGAEFADSYDPSLFHLPLALFALIGVGLTIYALHLALQRSTFTITSDALEIVTGSPLRHARRLFAREQLLAVRVAPSQFHANGVLLNELKIIPTGEDAFGLLKHLPDDELAAIAAALRAELNLSASTTVARPEDHPFLRRDEDPFSTRRAG